MAKSKKPPKKKGESDDSGTFDFLSRIFSFFGTGDSDSEKRRQLKLIAKQLKKHRFSFYKPKTGEVTSELGKFFYEIYKVVHPSKILIEHATESNVIKAIVIERYLTETQRGIQADLDEEVIRSRLDATDPKVLAQEYKEKLITFFSGFDAETVKRIDDAFNLLTIFLQFIRYDYYFVIKKFDSNIPENDFRYRPHIDSIDGKYVTDDIKDFLEVAPLIDPAADWNDLFELLAVYKGSPVMTQKAWAPLIGNLVEVVRSGVLLLLVRHIDEDPFYKSKFIVPNQKIVEEYLNKIKNQTEITIQKLLTERRSSKIDSLAQSVFGTSSVSRMKNYTEKANLSFAKKMLGGYTYVAPMNYLKAFLIDYLKSDIKSVVDVLLIRGHWSTTVLSQQLSESFHKLMDLSQQLLAFDDELSDEGQKGVSIKNAMLKSDRDKGMVRVLRQYLADANNEAIRIIKECVQNLISVAKHLKTVLDDKKSLPAEVIVNWREIEAGFEKNIDTEIGTIYKKIYYLSQLLQYFVKK